MIKFTLKCENDHSFDSWFQNADAYDKLRKSDMVACSVCGSLEVEKAIMAPRVRAARDAAKPEHGPLSAPASPAEQAMAELRRHVEENSENVGENFAKEARAIYEGEAPERSIYGEAKIEDAKKLFDDGVPVAPLPWGRKRAN